MPYNGRGLLAGSAIIGVSYWIHITLGDGVRILRSPLGRYGGRMSTSTGAASSVSSRVVINFHVENVPDEYALFCRPFPAAL